MSDLEILKKKYDAACKSVLAEKEILARILKVCVPEYRDCSYEDIVNLYLTEDAAVGEIPVEPGALASRLGTQQTEDSSETEGTIFYDIRFTTRAPGDGHLIELIINIEAQNDFNPGYPLLKRALYYCSRMISGQYGTVFVKSHYEKIEKVYSIWICTSPTKEWAYTISDYSMAERNIIGKAHAKREDYDLLTTVLICLGRKRYTELQGLLSMLNLVLLDNLDEQHTRNSLIKDFNIHMTPHLEKGVAEMCNLSAGIERRGLERGMQRGIQQGMERGMQQGIAKSRKETALRMIRMGSYSPQLISTISGLSLAEVEKLLQGNEGSAV